MQWIDIKEQMPEETMRVLLYTPYTIFGTDHACVGNRDSIAACTTVRGNRLVPVFTHWMPLPETPVAMNN